MPLPSSSKGSSAKPTLRPPISGGNPGGGTAPNSSPDSVSRGIHVGGTNGKGKGPR